MASPFRLKLEGRLDPPLDVLQANAAANAHQPKLTAARSPTGRKLAIVGGSPYIERHLEELRAWDGDVWGINRTAQWLNERGVKATLFTIDGSFFESSVQDRILATACDPRMFVGNVLAFDTSDTHPETGFAGGQASVTRAPSIALTMGYLDVSFFGCEGSFELNADHIDRHEADPMMLIIRAGDRDFLTRMDFCMFSEELAKLITAFGVVFKNRSGGLLEAMIANPDTWHVVGVSAALKAHLEEVNGKQGLYDAPYVPARAA